MKKAKRINDATRVKNKKRNQPTEATHELQGLHQSSEADQHNHVARKKQEKEKRPQRENEKEKNKNET